MTRILFVLAFPVRAHRDGRGREVCEVRAYESSRGYLDRRAVRRRKLRRRRRRFIFLAGEAALAVILAVAFLLSRNGDREFSGELARTAAKISGAGAVERYAKRHGFDMEDYPQELLELYERNPETKDFVCEYPEKKDREFEIDLSKYRGNSSVPLFLQWDERWGYHRYSGNVMGLTGCGPTCLSMVAVYLSGDTSMNPAWMADFATEHGYASEGSGSAWALFSEGGEKLGFDVTEIPLDRQRVIDNLEVNNPVVAVMGPGDFTTSGHFIVFTGYEDGKIRVNDPNSRENSKKRWDFDDISGQIKQLWVFRR